MEGGWRERGNPVGQVNGSGEELRVEVDDGEVGGVAEDGLSQDGVSFISKLYKNYPSEDCIGHKKLINVRETKVSWRSIRVEM